MSPAPRWGIRPPSHLTVQAVGIVTDHRDGCAFRASAERARRAFVRPLTS